MPLRFWGTVLLLRCCSSLGAETAWADSLAQRVAEQLQARHPTINAKTATGLAAEALQHQLQSEAISEEDAACTVDYSTLCPEGFADVGLGVCKAASWLQEGSCHGQVYAGGLTPQSKAAVAKGCGTRYSCVSERQQDFTKDCPEGWALEGESCTAGDHYSGPCVGVRAFSELGVEAKKRWAQLCKAPWPRRSQQQHSQSQGCMPDWAQVCPAGWASSKEGLCLAPTGYQGICGLRFQLAALSLREKMEFAELCGVAWPCAQDAA